MNRIPIRIRLTLPFAIAMAIVLAGTGAFVYVRVGDQLLGSVDANLRAQLEEVASNAREQHRSLIDRDASDGPSIAAVELPSGESLARTPPTLGPVPVSAHLRGTALFTT